MDQHSRESVGAWWESIYFRGWARADELHRNYTGRTGGAAITVEQFGRSLTALGATKTRTKRGIWYAKCEQVFDPSEAAWNGQILPASEDPRGKPRPPFKRMTAVL
jgi:hypothetical protein